MIMDTGKANVIPIYVIMFYLTGILMETTNSFHGGLFIMVVLMVLAELLSMSGAQQIIKQPQHWNISKMVCNGLAYHPELGVTVALKMLMLHAT